MQAFPPEKYILYGISILFSVRLTLVLTCKRSMTLCLPDGQTHQEKLRYP